MARNIKIELELPDFERELNISVTLTKDGERLRCSSHPSEVKTSVCPTTQQVDDPLPTRPSSNNSGNFMNLNF